ncbi:META domain-containing protein [Halomonas denitrificans]|uniref:META domain-containing protein n=1 Tax=Halomonas denitrificans TaxID=370769 RepID=UPI001CD3E809|nr:META domain-containing protein [Halomonas denitrificans]MCA0975641.1 META domain-containing protein [Halomonas denitrificans]
MVLLRMVLPRLRRITALSVCALALGACSSQPSSTVDGGGTAAPGSVSSPVVGKRWNLLLVGTSDRLSMPNKPYFEVARDGSVSGSDGCNQFTGSVRFGDSQRIDFSELTATRMACANPQGAQQVRDMLDNAYRYLIDHDRLVFFGPNSLVLGGFRDAS